MISLQIVDWRGIIYGCSISDLIKLSDCDTGLRVFDQIINMMSLTDMICLGIIYLN